MENTAQQREGEAADFNCSGAGLRACCAPQGYGPGRVWKISRLIHGAKQ